MIKYPHLTHVLHEVRSEELMVPSILNQPLNCEQELITPITGEQEMNLLLLNVIQS